jgi:hypothetical protein
LGQNRARPDRSPCRALRNPSYCAVFSGTQEDPHANVECRCFRSRAAVRRLCLRPGQLVREIRPHMGRKRGADTTTPRGESIAKIWRSCYVPSEVAGERRRNTRRKEGWGAVEKAEGPSQARCRDRDGGVEGGTVADRDPLKAEKSKQSAKKVGCPTPLPPGNGNGHSEARRLQIQDASRGRIHPSASYQHDGRTRTFGA